MNTYHTMCTLHVVLGCKCDMRVLFSARMSVDGELGKDVLNPWLHRLTSFPVPSVA